MAFLHKSPGDIPASKTESSDEGKAALANFRSLIEGRRHCKYWNSPKDLGGVVSRTMATLTKTKPAIGWVRSNLVADESGAQEILRLRNRIKELEDTIAEFRTEAPAGSEDLAQGDEETTVHFRFKRHLNYEYDEEGDRWTWNELLAVLGPIMLGSATETEIKEQLAHAFHNRVSDKRAMQIYSAYVRDEDFQRVKIQFRALGLIVRAEPEARSITPGGTRWTLTPYGDSLMTRIAAVRSSRSTKASVE